MPHDRPDEHRLPDHSAFGVVNAGRFASTPPPSIPDHDLIRRIGEGSYGEVWLAKNLLGSYRAIKIVYRKTFQHDHPFEREFKGIRKFEPISRTHEGLVDILQIGRGHGYFFYMMELADAAKNPNSETRNPKEIRIPNDEANAANDDLRVSDLGLLSSFVIRHWDLYSPCTLASELHQHTRLPVDECVRLGLSLASALGHLHKHGLVHRDVKPSNIIFVRGVPKLADIGLVAEVSEARSYVGTEGFIPPGGPGTPQADLYSLGKLLYEAATGKDRHAFPELPTNLGESSDPRGLVVLNAILLKACQPDIRQRYQTAEEMHADLALLQRGKSVRQQRTLERRWTNARKLALVTAGIALLAVFGYSTFDTFVQRRSVEFATRSGRSTADRRLGNTAIAADRASIFVLPFRNDGTNQVDELVRSRMTDAMIEGLGLFEGVNVRPRKSSWSKLDHATLMRRAAGELGARFVVTGEAAESSNRFGLMLRVLQTPGGRVVAQDIVRSDTNSLAALELAALEFMAKHLGLALDSDHRRQIEKKLADNLAAFNLQRQGVHYLYLATREGNASAIENLNRAVELDPRFVEAHTALAATYREMAYGERPPKEMWTEVRKHSALAFQIDNTLSLPRNLLAWSQFVQDYDWQGVMSALQTLMDEGVLDANGYASYLRFLGRMNEARREQDRAELQDPRNLYVRNGVTTQAFVERDYTRAIQKAQETISMYPQFPGGHDFLAQCYIEIGEFDKALGALESVRQVVDTAWGRALVGYTYAKMGRKKDAAAVLDKLRERANGTYVSPYCFALVHAGLGQDEAALDELERAYEYRCEELVNADAVGGLRTDPRLDSLRGHPRFQALLKKVGLDVWPR